MNQGPANSSSGETPDVLDAFGPILQQEVEDSEKKDSGSDHQMEKLLLDMAAIQEGHITKRLENADLRQSIKFRRRYSKLIFRLIIRWLQFIGFLVVLNGLNNCYIPFFGVKFPRFGWHLTDPVMIAVLGTTTITVVGLFGTVTGHFFNRGVFKVKKEDDKS